MDLSDSASSDDSLREIVDLIRSATTSTGRLDGAHDAVSRALDLNFDLRVRLLHVERRLLEVKAGLKTIEERQRTGAKKTLASKGFLSQFLAPYFKDESGFGCTVRAPGADWIRKPWLVNKKSDYSAVGAALKAYIIEELEEKAKNLQTAKKPVNGNKATLKSLLGNDLDRNFDWMKVSSNKLVGGLSDVDCQGIWNLVLKPELKMNGWNKTKHKLLKELALGRQFQNWDDIAREIHPDLTPFSAFVRFRRTLDHVLINYGSWSKAEDEHLLHIIGCSTIGKEIHWGKVMYYVEDRSVSQCITRWYRLNPALKRGRFSKEEDALLLHTVKQFGCDFQKISSVFGNRNLVQLRERYNVLKTALDKEKKSGEWSAQEDEELLRLVKKHGESNWKNIAAEMPARNRVQIRQRYSAVLKLKLQNNPDLDLKTLARVKRSSGAKIDESVVESFAADENIRNFIQDKVAGGVVAMPAPSRPGRHHKPTQLEWYKRY